MQFTFEIVRQIKLLLKNSYRQVKENTETLRNLKKNGRVSWREFIDTLPSAIPFIRENKKPKEKCVSTITHRFCWFQNYPIT